jgi:hypothetical protein
VDDASLGEEPGAHKAPGLAERGFHPTIRFRAVHHARIDADETCIVENRE